MTRTREIDNQQRGKRHTLCEHRNGIPIAARHPGVAPVSEEVLKNGEVLRTRHMWCPTCKSGYGAPA